LLKKKPRVIGAFLLAFLLIISVIGLKIEFFVWVLRLLVITIYVRHTFVVFECRGQIRWKAISMRQPNWFVYALVAVFILPSCLTAQPLLDDGKLLGIPEQIASITDINLPARISPEYILIQDVHQHPEAQSHIAALLMYGYSHWGIRSVFIEGAFAAVDLGIFREVPVQARAELVKRLAAEGRLTGAEIAAVLLSPRPKTFPLKLIGMENPDVYERNVETYLTLERLREPAIAELNAIRRLQQKMSIPSTHVLVRQLERTRLLLQLKLTPEEYDEYLQARDATPSSPTLDPVIAMAEQFYGLVNERSRLFMDEIKTKSFSEKGPRVVVVGGFHTAEMARQLRAEGRTFVVLSPVVTRPQNTAMYEQRMLESVSALQILPSAAFSK